MNDKLTIGEGASLFIVVALLIGIGWHYADLLTADYEAEKNYAQRCAAKGGYVTKLPAAHPQWQRVCRARPADVIQVDGTVVN